MKKLVLLLGLVGSVAFAQGDEPGSETNYVPEVIIYLNVDAPVVRVIGTNIVQVSIKGIPDYFNDTVRYKAATDRHYKDGWRQATIVTNMVTVTNALPAQIVDAANLYQALMESVLGPGAHTNTAYTYEEVLPQLVLNTNISADVGVRLEKLYFMLKNWSKDQKVYNYPFGQTEAVRDVPRLEFMAVEP